MDSRILENLPMGLQLGLFFDDIPWLIHGIFA